MSLPLQVVERLFDRLIATYGNDFLNRYAGLDIVKIKTMWAHELSGFSENLGSIAHALEVLPERAPNIVEFKNMCIKAPSAQQVILEAPRADPAIVKAIADGIRAKAVAKVDCREWARVILANPKGRTPAVVQMAKNALEIA